MDNKLFVGSLPWAVDDAALADLFAPYGEVSEARVVTDRDTDRSRGFGFVTFATAEEAKAAIDALDGSQIEGREINVSVAKPTE